MKSSVLRFEKLHGGYRNPQVRRFANFVIKGGVTPPTTPEAQVRPMPLNSDGTTPAHISSTYTTAGGGTPPTQLNGETRAQWLGRTNAQIHWEHIQTTAPNNTPNPKYGTPPTDPNSPVQGAPTTPPEQPVQADQANNPVTPGRPTHTATAQILRSEWRKWRDNGGGGGGGGGDWGPDTQPTSNTDMASTSHANSAHGPPVQASPGRRPRPGNGDDGSPSRKKPR